MDCNDSIVSFLRDALVEFIVLTALLENTSASFQKAILSELSKLLIDCSYVFAELRDNLDD